VRPLLTAVLLLASTAAAPRTYTVQPGSTLAYDLVHKFHHVHGVSRSVEGKARVLPDGTVQVMVRAPIDSFDSGNSNRDAHMLEVTEAAQNPYVLFKGIGTLTSPSSYPADAKVELRGELTLKTARPIQVPVAVHFASAERATIDATFPVSLDEHHVERPSLLFVKVDDRITIEANLALEADR
jgi:hypothetical protein